MTDLPDSEFSDFEIKIMRTVDVFQTKPIIMKKAEHRLLLMKDALANSLNKNRGICPEDADCTKGQIARGENHNGFPYISLDLPQLFTKELFFTYRVLFWWGHYLGFSMILKGGKLDEYKNALTTQVNDKDSDSILFSFCKTPWEWELGESRFRPVNQTTSEDIQQHVKNHGFIKLLVPLDVHQENFTATNWSDSGIRNYRAMARLIGESIPG